MTTESLPHIQTHINRVVVAQVSIRNNSLSRNAIVRHRDNLAAELVVLCRAILVKDIGGHSNKRHVGINILEVGADAAGTVLPEDVAALGWGAKSVDGAVLVGAGDGSGGDFLAWGGRGSEGQAEDCKGC